jgi:membrane protease YdiL (CAAX protease family)
VPYSIGMPARIDSRLCIEDGADRLLRREVATFLALATLAAGAVLLLMLGRIPPDFPRGNEQAAANALGGLVMVYGFGPFVAATIAAAVFRGRSGLATLFRRVVTWRVSPWLFGAALVLPIVPQWLGLFVWSWLTGHELTLPSPSAYVSSWLQVAAISALYFISEELGWRGFLLPRVLARHQWINAAVRVGFIWAVWHYPYWIVSSWLMAESWPDIGVSLLASSCRAVALSVVMTWIFRSSCGSVLLAMIFHGSNNASFGKMFDAAGAPALDGPAFLAVQGGAAVACALALVALLASRPSKRTNGGLG